MIAEHKKTHVKGTDYKQFQKNAIQKELGKKESVIHETNEDCLFCKKPFTKEQRECLRQLYNHNHNNQAEERAQNDVAK